MNKKTKDETNILITQGEINVTTNSNKDKKSKEQKIDDYLLEDWKIAQNTIQYFDTIIVDLRKYGFTIITGLLTAEFLLGITEKKFLEIVPITLITIILISALFTIDIYFDSLLRSAVRRAVYIEKRLPMNTCFQISAFAEKAGTNTAGILLYGIFITAGTIPLWYVPFSNDPIILILHISLISFPICSFIVIIYLVLWSFIDIKFDKQCDRNAEALENEYVGQIDKAINKYKKNVEENYPGDFSYYRLAEKYRKKNNNNLDMEIKVLKMGISNIRKKVSTFRPDKDSKLEFFMNRLKIAEFIKKWKDNKKFKNNLESNIKKLRNRIRKINGLIEKYQYRNNKRELKRLKNKLKLINHFNQHLHYNANYIKELKYEIEEKEEYANLINYLKNRSNKKELEKELEFLNRELELRLQLENYIAQKKKTKKKIKKKS